MAEGLKGKNLEEVLAGLQQGWRELAEMLRFQVSGPDRIIEAEKFVLVDPGGRRRGWLEAREDGSSGLVLQDKDGRYRAWLGIKEEGQAYMSLKDRFGRVFWEVQEPQGLAWVVLGSTKPEPQASSATMEIEKVEKEGQELAEAGETPGLSGSEDGPEAAAQSPAAPFSTTAGKEDDMEKGPHLAQLQRQIRGLKLGSGLLAATMLAAWVAVGILWTSPPQQVKPHPAEAFTLKDDRGVARAWLGLKTGGVRLDLMDNQAKVRTTLALDQEGAPRLQLYDAHEKLRSELALNSQGEPGLSLIDQAGLLRVALGRVSPGFQASEETQERPLDSLVLFNQNGYAVWRAPLRWRR